MYVGKSHVRPRLLFCSLLLGGSVSLVDDAPVDNSPEVFDGILADVAVVDVVGVLPDV